VKLGVAPLLLTLVWTDAPPFEGRVVNPQGVAVDGAQVELISDDATVWSRVETDSDGRFRLPRSPEATRVRVRCPGFLDVEVALPNSADGKLEIVLTLAGFTEHVAVTATRRERALFDTPQSVSVVTTHESTSLLSPPFPPPSKVFPASWCSARLWAAERLSFAGSWVTGS
jgi:hypothetical protein